MSAITPTSIAKFALSAVVALNVAKALLATPWTTTPSSTLTASLSWSEPLWLARSLP